MVGIAHNIPEIISPSLKEEIVANKQLIVSMAKNPPTIDKIENLNNNTNIKMIIIVEKILIFLSSCMNCIRLIMLIISKIVKKVKIIKKFY